FRTPWLMRTVHRLGYSVVTWDSMTDDWRANTPVDEIVRAIVRRAKPGSVIVLHDGRDTRPSYDRTQMLRALPQIIDTLRQRGFDFVTIPELLGLEAKS
ncbi:MAG: polysaccharide deacetylase family protein, partial [Chloroflexi bacterium]|nr:polysaccharide deacetylase family protein [Chloroflexota bacterium]